MRRSAVTRAPSINTRDPRKAVGEPANRRDRRVAFGHVADSGHVLERLDEIGGRTRADLRRRQRRPARDGCALDAARRSRDSHEFVDQRLHDELDESVG